MEIIDGNNTYIIQSYSRLSQEAGFEVRSGDNMVYVPLRVIDVLVEAIRNGN